MTIKILENNRTKSPNHDDSINLWLNQQQYSSELRPGAYSISGNSTGPAGVQDHEDFPSAVEYDPDAKQAKRQSWNRRRIACFVLTAMILAAGGTVTAWLLGRKNASEPPKPTVVLPYRETIGIQEKVQQLIIDPALLNDASSPYKHALDWITHDDPQMLPPESKTFLQRYIAAYLYFATSVKHPWSSCARAMGNQSEFCEMDLYPYDGVLTRPSMRWLSNSSICSWAGIGCDSADEVQSIVLSGNNLTGTFPEGIEHFPYLQSFQIEGGSLSGTVPLAALSRMRHLNHLRLSGNEFTGSLPREIWEMRSLYHIAASSNSLGGTFPNDVGRLQEFKTIILKDNQLKGSLSTDIGLLRNMHYLSLSGNQLKGTIPSEIGLMSMIYRLGLEHNQLTGTIPKEIGQLSNLVYLELDRNQLTGEVPEEMWDIAQLLMIHLNDNKLSGTLSKKVSFSGGSRYIELQNNHFQGTVPEGDDEAFSHLLLNGNDFTGTMPESICKWRRTDGYGLSELTADCTPDPGTDDAELECNCCTRCCNREGRRCIQMDS